MNFLLNLSRTFSWHDFRAKCCYAIQSQESPRLVVGREAQILVARLTCKTHNYQGSHNSALVNLYPQKSAASRQTKSTFPTERTTTPHAHSIKIKWRCISYLLVSLQLPRYQFYLLRNHVADTVAFLAELIDRCVGSRIWVVMKGEKGVMSLYCHVSTLIHWSSRVSMP